MCHQHATAAPFHYDNCPVAKRSQAQFIALCNVKWSSERWGGVLLFCSTGDYAKKDHILCDVYCKSGNNSNANVARCYIFLTSLWAQTSPWCNCCIKLEKRKTSLKKKGKWIHFIVTGPHLSIWLAKHKPAFIHSDITPSSTPPTASDTNDPPSNPTSQCSIVQTWSSARTSTSLISYSTFVCLFIF